MRDGMVKQVKSLEDKKVNPVEDKKVNKCQKCGKEFTEQTTKRRHQNYENRVYRRHDMFMCWDCMRKEKKFKRKRERLRAFVGFTFWGKH